MEEGLSIRHPQRAKIVMVTAVGDKSHVVRAIQEQCDGYLLKPMNRDKMVRELQRLKLIL